MNRRIRALLAALLAGVAGWAPAASPPPSERPGTAMVLTIEGAIGPASADYVQRGIERAAAAQAALVVLQIDTPGGLDTSMRQIVKAILASPVPVGLPAPRVVARADGRTDDAELAILFDIADAVGVDRSLVTCSVTAEPGFD